MREKEKERERKKEYKQIKCFVLVYAYIFSTFSFLVRMYQEGILWFIRM